MSMTPQTQESKIIRCGNYNTWELDNLLQQGYRVLTSTPIVTQTGIASSEYPAPPPIVEHEVFLVREIKQEAC